jgi:hypothetical protein
LLLASASGAGVQCVLTPVIAAGDPHLLVWHVTDGGNKSSALNAKLRAFGSYPELAAGEAAASATVSAGSRNIFADARWASPDARPELLQLVARTQSAADTALAFFPTKDAAVAGAWGRTALALLWLWAERSAPAPKIDRKTASLAALGALIARTLDLDGTLGLIVPSENSGSMLWLIGPPSRIDRLCHQLDEEADIEWLAEIDDVTRLWWFPLADG